MPIDINKLLTEAGAKVVNFQPRVELSTPNLPSILLSVGKILVPSPSVYFSIVYPDSWFTLAWQ